MKQLYELQRMDLTDLLLYAQKANIHLFSAEREEIIKAIHDTESYRQAQSLRPDVDFFEKECKGGATVYFYGMYQEDGDFGTFSKIVTSMKITKEQRSLFEDEKGERKYYNSFAELIKNNDPEIISIDFQIQEEN